MQKIFTSTQIKAIDRYTIENEPVTSFDLMERASRSLFVNITRLVSRDRQIMVFAGTGNNGGDGLAVARMLAEDSYRVAVFVINISSVRSPEWERNLSLLAEAGNVHLMVIDRVEDLPFIPADTVVIDALFGSGLTRSPEGLAAETIRLINDSDSLVIAVDVPSGLPGEDSSNFDRSAVVRARHTLVLEFPRLSFFFEENHCFTGRWTVVPIDLHPMAVARTDTPYLLADKASVAGLLRRRSKFDHKGNYGHALLVAGSSGKMGAAVLAARATLRTGAGLLTCHIPARGYDIIQTAVPEAMAQTDKSDLCISGILSPSLYDAIGAGPGIGTDTQTQEAVHNLLEITACPMVIDADALNILALNKKWLELLGPRIILTPHPGEFARLAGESSSGYQRMTMQLAFSARYKCIVVLKGAHTMVTTPEGRVFVNSTGNPGMATAGSGDVLTGIILGLLAQGCQPENAAVTGVFLHGLAGDIAASEKCQESMIASDITENIHSAYTKIRQEVL